MPLAAYIGNWWTFSIGPKLHDLRELRRRCEVTTKYYAEDVHCQAFLPQSLRKSLIGGEGQSRSKNTPDA